MTHRDDALQPDRASLISPPFRLAELHFVHHDPRPMIPPFLGI